MWVIIICERMIGMKAELEIKARIDLLNKQLVEVDASIMSKQGNITPRALNQVLDLKMQIVSSIAALEWVLDGGEEEAGAAVVK